MAVKRTRHATFWSIRRNHKRDAKNAGPPAAECHDGADWVHMPPMESLMWPTTISHCLSPYSGAMPCIVAISITSATCRMPLERAEFGVPRLQASAPFFLACNHCHCILLHCKAGRGGASLTPMRSRPFDAGKRQRLLRFGSLGWAKWRQNIAETRT